MFNLGKKFWFILLLVVIIPTFSTLIRPGYFPMHDDMQAMRLFEMDKCFHDFQIPCRWVPDMGYGYGYPQFNYYGPLPYYAMEIFHLGGFGFLDSVKIGFILSVLVSAAGMFLLGSSLWGGLGGFISGILFAYAPYRAVDMYVRGAVGEFWALSFFPFIFWSVREIIKGNKKGILWLALSLAALITSHNISTVMFFPVLVAWAIFILLKEKKFTLPSLKNNLLGLFFAGLWGFFIAAFFLVPAWFEKGYAHIETLTVGYFNYLAHFLNIGQILFSTYWNFGASELGPYDEMFLGVGLIHWILPLILIITALILKKRKELATVLFLTSLGWVALFLTQSRSTFIWQKIGILTFLQFPWRFLVIATFLFSLAGGALSHFVEKEKKTNYSILLIFAAYILLFYGSYFKTNGWYQMTDQDKFSGELWQKELTISIFDYLPIYAKFPPIQEAPGSPIVVAGEVNLLYGEKGTDWQKWTYEVKTESQMELPLYYFPGWKVWIDGQEATINYDNDLGLINFNVGEGRHEILARLTNTPVREIGNLMSLAGMIAIPLFVVKARKK